MKLNYKNSLFAAIILLLVLLVANSKIYAFPDFISISIGSLGGSYLAGWVIWFVFKRFVSAEKVDKRFSIFAIAGALSLLNILNNLKF